MVKRFQIKEGIKQPVTLRASAHRAGAVTAKGTISRAWLNKSSEKMIGLRHRGRMKALRS